MEAVEMLEEALRVLDYSLSQINWRLKAASKRRLETDILALYTRMRPVIMVDYGGVMPVLTERLCALLKHSQKESSIFEQLRVMVIEDMIYLIHAKGLAELVKSTINNETELHFVDLEQDPPKMITKAEKSSVGTQLISVQKLFSSIFCDDVTLNNVLQCRQDLAIDIESSSSQLLTHRSLEFIDLSHCLQDSMVTVPTLNGWLLGYPVVYLFGREHITNAIYNLSTRSLHLFKISVSRSNSCRNDTTNKGYQQEELMSFSVPYELSLEGRDEPWAETFLARMQARWEGCRQVWGSLQMEVSCCYPQAIVL